MENKNEILNRLSLIRETEEYTSGDLDFIMEQLESEDDTIRAAAILASQGALYHLPLMEKILEIGREEWSIPVRRAAFRMMGQFITSCVLEGYEELEPYQKGLDYEEEFDELLEHGLEEKYQEVKSFILEFLESEDMDHELYSDALLAVLDIADSYGIEEKVRDLWNKSGEETRKKLIPFCEVFPYQFQDLIRQGLEQGQDRELTVLLLRSAAGVKEKSMADLVQTFLHSPDEEIVSTALITLAELNLTKQLEQLLHEYCLHEKESIQLSARKALDILSRNNFDSYMKKFYG